MPKFTYAALEAALPDSLRTAIAAAPMPSLGESEIDDDLHQWIVQHGDVGLDEMPGGDTCAVGACRDVASCTSGLWLLAGDIHQSHEISQDLSHQEGSFWHGIMHRREGDYGNAKYWFRRVDHHAVMRQMPDVAAAAGIAFPAAWVTGGIIDGANFVDAIRMAHQSGKDLQAALDMQWIEWQCLFAWCAGVR